MANLNHCQAMTIDHDGWKLQPFYAMLPQNQF